MARPRTGYSMVAGPAMGALAVSGHPVPTHGDTSEPITPEEGELARQCGCSVPELRRQAGAMLHYLVNMMKGGNINQGYAQCGVDKLAIAVARGECSIERVQCRVPIGLRATAVAGGATVTHEIKPVGPAFLREIIVTRHAADVPASPNFEAWITQIAGAGRFAQTGVATSANPGQPGAGAFPMEGFGRSLQNYVASSGILFDSSTPLVVSTTNVGPDTGSYSMMLTYDLIRAG